MSILTFLVLSTLTDQFIYAKKDIPLRTKFGPFEGDVKVLDADELLAYRTTRRNVPLLFVDETSILDVSNESKLIEYGIPIAKSIINCVPLGRNIKLDALRLFGRQIHGTESSAVRNRRQIVFQKLSIHCTETTATCRLQQRLCQEIQTAVARTRRHRTQKAVGETKSLDLFGMQQTFLNCRQIERTFDGAYVNDGRTAINANKTTN